jgi:phenol 2-monooxygenase (NADPH)
VDVLVVGGGAVGKFDIIPWKPIAL